MSMNRYAYSIDQLYPLQSIYASKELRENPEFPQVVKLSELIRKYIRCSSGSYSISNTKENCDTFLTQPFDSLSSEEEFELLVFLFDTLMESLKERLDRPLKSCVLLPGKYGKPAECGSAKDKAVLESCMSDIFQYMKQVTEARNTVRKSSRSTFLTYAVNLFDTVMKSTSCNSLERILNFSTNSGKYTQGMLSLFLDMAPHWIQRQTPASSTSSSRTSSYNTNTNINTFVNASSVGGRRRTYKNKRRATRKVHRRRRMTRKQ